MPRYSSLEDFLAASELTVDQRLDDGSDEGSYMLKGREIDATVLFSDISAFTSRTKDLLPVETLMFVNWFFHWITRQALNETHGIVDKYIGDEVMILFSAEFGSTDPFAEAVATGRWMAQNDVSGFVPHIGIASGAVIVGYVGTPLKYQCSAFGLPVALAARCASLPPSRDPEAGPYGSWMVFPAGEWGERELDKIVPSDRADLPSEWKLLDPRTEELKGIGPTEIRAIVREGFWTPGLGRRPEEWVRETVRRMKLYGGRYWPRESEDS